MQKAINILYTISKLWLNNILLIRNNSDESHNVPSIFFMSQKYCLCIINNLMKILMSPYYDFNTCIWKRIKVPITAMLSRQIKMGIRRVEPTFFCVLWKIISSHDNGNMISNNFPMKTKKWKKFSSCLKTEWTLDCLHFKQFANWIFFRIAFINFISILIRFSFVY